MTLSDLAFFLLLIALLGVLALNISAHKRIDRTRLDIISAHKRIDRTRLDIISAHFRIDRSRLDIRGFLDLAADLHDDDTEIRDAILALHNHVCPCPMGTDEKDDQA